MTYGARTKQHERLYRLCCIACRSNFNFPDASNSVCGLTINGVAALKAEAQLCRTKGETRNRPLTREQATVIVQRPRFWRLDREAEVLTRLACNFP